MARASLTWHCHLQSVAVACSPPTPCRHSSSPLCRDVVEVNQFVDERQLRAATRFQHESRTGSRAGSRTASGIDLAALQQQGEEGSEEAQQAMETEQAVAAGQPAAELLQNGALLQQQATSADATAFVAAAAPQPARGRGRGGRGGGRGGGRAKRAAVEYDEESSEEESDPDAGAEDVSDDEYVPGR